MGMILIGLAIARLETSTQIGYEENPGPWKTLKVFLEEGQLCRVEIIADESEIGRNYKITVTQVEEMRMLYEAGGPIERQVIPQRFPAETTGHYEIDWHDLNVSRITAYRVGDLIPRYPVSVAGVFVLMAGIVSFLGLERKELFRGEKTHVFWLGLIIFGLTITYLFGLLWWGFVLEVGVYYLFSIFWPSNDIWPKIFGSGVFLLIGLYMMKSGAKKKTESQN